MLKLIKSDPLDFFFGVGEVNIIGGIEMVLLFVPLDDPLELTERPLYLTSIQLNSSTFLHKIFSIFIRLVLITSQNSP